MDDWTLKVSFLAARDDGCQAEQDIREEVSEHKGFAVYMTTFEVRGYY